MTALRTKAPLTITKSGSKSVDQALRNEIQQLRGLSSQERSYGSFKIGRACAALLLIARGRFMNKKLCSATICPENCHLPPVMDTNGWCRRPRFHEW